MRSWFPPFANCAKDGAPSVLMVPTKSEPGPPAERVREPQGLKPKSISGAYGTAEAVPFHKPHG